MEPVEAVEAVEAGSVLVVVEMPMGSRNKYELDRQSGRMLLDRMLVTTMGYPADYGFIDGTLGDDGDPLDALVLVGAPTFPGCGIRARPIGVFIMRDEKGRDEKVLCVPLRDPRWSHVHALDDVASTYLQEIEHFFQQYGHLEGKEVETGGFDDEAAARRIIEEARVRELTHRSSTSPPRPAGL